MHDLDTRIRLAASSLLGWGYGQPPRVPVRPSWWPASTKVATTERDELIDCSTTTAWVLAEVYPDGKWVLDPRAAFFYLPNGQRSGSVHRTEADYAALQIFAGQSPWSPIAAVERVGVGIQVTTPSAGRWHLVQSWRDPKALQGGHSRLIYVREDGSLLVLESTTRDDDADGVRDGVRWVTLPGAASVPGETRWAVLRE